MAKLFWCTCWIILSTLIDSVFSQTRTADIPWSDITTFSAFVNLPSCAQSCIYQMGSSLQCERIECLCTTNLQGHPLSSCIVTGCQNEVSIVTSVYQSFCGTVATTTSVSITKDTAPSIIATTIPSSTIIPSQTPSAEASWTGITTLSAFSNLRLCAQSCITQVESSLRCEHISCFCNTGLQDQPLSSCVRSGCQDELDVSIVTGLYKSFCGLSAITTNTTTTTNNNPSRSFFLSIFLIQPACLGPLD